MLKQANSTLVEGNYIGIKFVTGEDILCKVGAVNTSSGEVVILRPHFISQSNGSIAFVPWPTMIDDTPDNHKVVIPFDKILVSYPLREDFRKIFPEAIGEGPSIIVPDKKIVTL